MAEWVRVVEDAELLQLLVDQADHVIHAHDRPPAVAKVLVDHRLHLRIDRRVLRDVSGLVLLPDGGIVRRGATTVMLSR